LLHVPVSIVTLPLLPVPWCLLLQVGGLLLVVPEHRMSLELKWHELRMKNDPQALALCQELAALAAAPYLDVLDESDELLHHRCGRTLVGQVCLHLDLCWLLLVTTGEDNSK
jgi:hypothetical protein